MPGPGDASYQLVRSTGLALALLVVEPGRRVETGLPDWTMPAPPTLAQSLLLPFARRRAPT